MKRAVIILLAVTLPLLVMAQHSKFIIDGKIISDTLTTGKIYLSYEDNGRQVRDSSAIVKNTYHFQGEMADGGITANLFLEETSMSHRFKGFSQFYVQPGHVYLVHKSNFNRLEIKGSLLQLQADTLAKLERDARMNHSGSENGIGIDFIKTHPDSWLSYVILQNHLVRMNDLQPDEADPLYEALSSQLKKYSSVVMLKSLIDGRRAAVVGKPAIDFTEKEVNGQQISLSSYRGKYILVDFWASWCHPCRAENPNVTAAYHTFRDKGLNILSISLDTQRDSWLQAVKQDHLEWTQASNLKGFDDEVAVKYGIHAIPSNFLIDPNGVIVAKDLRGKDLDNKLTEVLK